MDRTDLNLLAQVEPYVGRYYSTEYVRRKVLQQKDQEIIEIDMQIEDEIERGIIPDPNEQMLEMEPGMAPEGHSKHPKKMSVKEEMT